MAFLRRWGVSPVLIFFCSVSFVLRAVDSQIYGTGDPAFIGMPRIPDNVSEFSQFWEEIEDIENLRQRLNSALVEINKFQIRVMVAMSDIEDLKISQRDKELINDFADRWLQKLKAMAKKTTYITSMALLKMFAEIARDLKLGLEPLKLEEIEPTHIKLREVYNVVMSGGSIEDTEIVDTLFRFFNIMFDMLAGNMSHDERTRSNDPSAGSNIVPPSASRGTADASARPSSDKSQNRKEDQRTHSTPDTKTSTTESEAVRLPSEVGESVDVESYRSPVACINIRRSPPGISRSGFSAVGFIAVHTAAVTFIVAAI